MAKSEVVIMFFLRAVLFILGVFFLGYGVWIWMNPTMLATDILAIAAPHSDALMSEVHATYSGLQGLVGLVLLCIALFARGRLPVAACGWTALFFAGLALPRAAHHWLYISGMPQGYVLWALLFEWIALVLLLVAYLSARRA